MADQSDSDGDISLLLSSSSISFRIVMRMLAMAAFSRFSPVSSPLPEREKRRLEVMGARLSSLKETRASTRSYFLKMARAGYPS
jgi:hypothetical protein